MSAYGAGITIWRKDGTPIDEDTAQSIVELLDHVAQQHDRCGAFEDQSECGLGWEEDEGGYTLVATSSYAYHHATPEDVREDGLAHDLEFAQWLTTQIEAAHPGVFRFEVDEHEW